MVEPASRAVAVPGRYRAPLAIVGRVLLLRDEVVVASADLARFGLVALALALQTAVLASPGHFRPAGQWYFAAFVALGTLASLGLCLMATLPLRDVLHLRLRRGLAVAAFVALPILSIMGAWHGVLGVRSVLSHTPPSNDGAVMDIYAARQVLKGHDPYKKTSIVAALAALNAPATTTTPLMDGQFRGARAYPSAGAVYTVFLAVLKGRPHTIPPEFESKYNYPAGSFLFILPFLWAGIHDMRFLYALAVVLMGVYLWKRSPRALRPLVPLIVLGNVPLVILTAGDQPDPIYGLFLMLGYAEWASPWISPLAVGVAAGTKQLTWFFLPFYFLLIARELGWREATRRVGIIAAVFTVMNAPFFLQSPSSYIASISGPMADPMFPLGIGIIALFVSNGLPVLPKVVFTIMEIGAWAGGVVGWMRVRSVATAAAGAVLGALPLFFAWRSLVNYFYLVPLLALAIVLAEPAQRTLLRRRSA
jgi:hypothetical protein